MFGAEAESHGDTRVPGIVITVDAGGSSFS